MQKINDTYSNMNFTRILTSLDIQKIATLKNVKIKNI